MSSTTTHNVPFTNSNPDTHVHFGAFRLFCVHPQNNEPNPLEAFETCDCGKKKTVCIATSTQCSCDD